MSRKLKVTIQGISSRKWSVSQPGMKGMGRQANGTTQSLGDGAAPACRLGREEGRLPVRLEALPSGKGISRQLLKTLCGGHGDLKPALEIPLKPERWGKLQHQGSRAPPPPWGEGFTPLGFVYPTHSCCLVRAAAPPPLGKLAVSSKKQEVIICPKQTNSQTTGFTVSPKL